jgi:hypothetical protein
MAPDGTWTCFQCRYRAKPTSSITKQQLESRVAELTGELAQARAELAAWPEIPTTETK